MAHKLADETLAEILDYSLKVPDEDFASLAELSESPFVNRQTSSSTPLVVCKRWMRISTPLLYNTVILRSTAQADALALALKANPTFGQYVKKLRIEGGFGVSVRKILEWAPDITDIWLMLNYTSDDKPKPMCAALERAANIRRLIIYRSGIVPIANNANTRLVMSTVAQCITSWTSLRIVQLKGDTATMEPLRRTLLTAKHLEELRFPEDSVALPTFVCECPANVKHIRVGWPDPGDGYFRGKNSQYLREKERIPRTQLAKVIFAAPAQTACIAPPPNPFYQPMKHTPSNVRRKIWSRVFELLFEDYRRSKHDGTAAFMAWGPMKFAPRQQCMLVCSEFKDVILELACRHVSLHGLSTAEGFATCLAKMPYLSPLVETLDLTAHYHSFLFEPLDYAGQCFDMVKPHLPTLVNLRVFNVKFHDYPLQLKDLAALAPISETLRELTFHLDNRDDRYWSPSPPRLDYVPPRSPSPLPIDYQMHAFTSLQRLSLRIVSGAARHLSSPPLHALRQLECLHLEGGGCADFLRIICPLRLDRLRTLEVAGAWDADAVLEEFCATHGHKLHTLSLHEKSISNLLRHCPDIEFLVYPDDEEISFNRHPSVMYFKSAPVCLRLKEISVIAVDLRLYAGRGEKQHLQEVIGAWTELFNFFASAPQFPALKVVRVANPSGLWPTTEKEIAKSPLPGWAETLLERGIRLVDARGIGWTPRLKPHKKGRQ